MAVDELQSTTLYFGPWYRRSPFFAATLRHGCKAYDIYNHMYLPAFYDDPNTEYWALVNGVTLWDVGVERVVEISGPDGFELANMITCRDLTKCAVGQAKYALITAPDGGIVNDPVLLRRGENTFWLCLADGDAHLYALGVAEGRGLDATVSLPEVYALQVQGPSAKDVVGDLLAGSEELASLRYYWTLDAEIAGIPVVISRTGWTAEVGYEVYLTDAARGDDLWEAIMAAGRPYGIRPIAPCEARRIEAGIFNYNSDMTLANNPFEISGLERLVEEQEADYIGKAALEAIRTRGVTNKLVGIEVPGEPLAFEISQFRPALHQGVKVGHVTDLVWSPRLERNIGYVFLPIELSPPGTRINVVGPLGELAHGTTASIPFVDPGKSIPAHLGSRDASQRATT
ncbi:MAG: glycine cleavage system protein T [Actinomycetota bacterium]|nr:glycine cleavage system protein T [Actinomycetota bacterium]